VVGGAARLGLSAGAFLSAAGVAVARGDGPGVDPDAAAGVAGPATGEAAGEVGPATGEAAGEVAGGVSAGGAGRGVGSAGGVSLDRRTGDALDDLETQLGRIGNLLNQAVRVANSTGQVDGRLLGAADAVRRVAVRVDGVLDGVRLDRRGRAR